MNSTARHVVFGTGAIGLATLDALLRRSETVRMVNRSGSARVPDEVEVVGGDAADPQFTIEVTCGARVVYQTLNPPYERWVEEFPPSRPACSRLPRPRAPGWSAWRTSTCTGVRRAVR
jgi:nucleoside-diphosphate-sugar epimerase